MAYAILRTEKLKTMGNIGGSLAHNYRTRETPNAVPERLHLNTHDMASADEVKAAIVARLPEKRRSDAVLCVEYFIGASPDYFDGTDPKGERYFATAVEWLKERHGADNVVATSVHHDETSPHLVAYVVPLDQDGKLNAKAFLGGRAKLTAMQTDFAKAVGRHGLDRGLEGSKAKHQSIRDYYAKVNQTESAVLPKITPEDLTPKKSRGEGLLGRVGLQSYLETPEGIADRLNAKVLEATKAYRAKASEASQARKEAQAARKALDDQQKALKPFLDALRPLNEAERKTLAAAMTVDSAKMVRAREALEQERKAEQQRQRQERAVSNKSRMPRGDKGIGL
mgnify:FL=1|jgi:hypothetical protein